MKLVTLNIWGGKLKRPLLEFFKKYSQEVDIFCLQEVFHHGKSTYHRYDDADMNIFSRIAAVLSRYNGHFTTPQTDEFGLAIFVRKTIPVAKVGETYVFRWKNARVGDDGKTLGKHLQFVQFQHKGKSFTIINFHGLWIGGDKNDTPDRLQQSQNIVKFINTLKGKVILAGDYNLLPNTQSTHLLEAAGLRNLVTEYKITNTRSPFYARPEKFADYILVSLDVNVTNFCVLPDVVSDHLSLLIEFT